MPSYSSKQFLEEYELNIDKEFEYNGTIPSWAPNPNDGSDGGPRFWDTEDGIVPAPEKIIDAESRKSSSAQALSTDGTFLAIATDSSIRLYDVESLSMTDELILGYSGANYVRKLVFTTKKSDNGDKERLPEYMLISYSSAVGGGSGTIHIWDLDARGCLQQELRVPNFDADDLAKNAFQAIEENLSKYEVGNEQISEIQTGFLKTLKAVHFSHAMSKIKTIPGAMFPSFNPSIVAHSREKFLYEMNGQTTQHGMRPKEELPQTVVRTLEPFEEVCRLQGHTDGIMWMGWSLDDKIIATASWDKTFRIWNAETGDCKHVIGPTSGQNWAGQFHPDGKHILLSGGGHPHPLALYDIETGEKVRSFDPPDIKIDSWLRYFQVHPQEQEDMVVIQNGETLLAWQPLHPDNAVQVLFALKRQGDSLRDRFAAIYKFGWYGERNIFVAKATDGSTFVWDKSRGLKWRMERQKGRTGSGGGSALLVKRQGADWVASHDGDRAVRFWKL